MDYEQGAPRARRQWTPWGVFMVVAAILVVAFLAAVIGAAVLHANRATSQIAARAAKITAAGEPAGCVELEEHYRLPPGTEDTTDLWLDAVCPLETQTFADDAGELPVVGTGDSQIPPPGEPWKHLEAVEQLLRKYDVSLRTLHRAAELEGAARYPVDLTEGLSLSLDHDQPLRQGARLLQLEAQVRAHRGDPQGAARSIHAIFALARSLEREPVTISFLVRIACDGIAREQIKSLLPAVDFSEADLARLQGCLRAIDYHEGLYQAMLGERAMGFDIFEDPTSKGASLPRSKFWRFTQAGGFVFYLDHMDQLVAASQLPWPQALDAADRAEAELDALAKDASALTRMTHAFPILLAPALGTAFSAAAQSAASTDAADAAIAIELYRRRHDKLPERLDDLVPDFLPEVPIDPFDGAPLKYIVREKGHLIYSIGRDRVDNGGTADPERGDREPDAVFRVQRPKTSPTRLESP